MNSLGILLYKILYTNIIPTSWENMKIKSIYKKMGIDKNKITEGDYLLPTSSVKYLKKF